MISRIEYGAYRRVGQGYEPCPLSAPDARLGWGVAVRLLCPLRHEAVAIRCQVFDTKEQAEQYAWEWLSAICI